MSEVFTVFDLDRATTFGTVLGTLTVAASPSVVVAPEDPEDLTTHILTVAVSDDYVQRGRRVRDHRGLEYLVQARLAMSSSLDPGRQRFRLRRDPSSVADS